MVNGGYGCSDNGTSGEGGTNTYTFLDETNVMGGNTSLTQWCIRVTQSGESQTTRVKLKVFRINGSSYDLIASSGWETITNAGTHTFSLSPSIDVLSGDLIGLTIEGTASPFLQVRYDNTGSTIYRKSLEVTGNTTKASWTNISTTNLRINASDTIPPTDVYVNSSIGSDSNAGDSCTAGHPKLTFLAGYNLLASNGTIYICNDGADFSSENITFTKPYSTAQGVAGVTNYKSPRFN